MNISLLKRGKKASTTSATSENGSSTATKSRSRGLSTKTYLLLSNSSRTR
jgi:hypothetical protein